MSLPVRFSPESIARILGECRPHPLLDDPGAWATWNKVVQSFALNLSIRDPAYETDTFFDACGVIENR